VGRRRSTSSRDAIDEELARARRPIHALRMTQRAITQTRTVTTELELKAPQLKKLAELMLQVRQDPGDKKARIQLTLLKHSRVDHCPRCDGRLQLEDYRVTRTRFSEREVMQCACCHTAFLLSERVVA
jgi:hypothetical protein